MLKLIPAADMSYESVLEYYNAFKDVEDKWHEINSYVISSLVTRGRKEYYEFILTKEKNMYYLIDSNKEDYIIGFGSIDVDFDYHDECFNIGNIGYGIRPNERNKGYGTKLLELLLLKCEEENMNEVCVSCGKENIASQKVIINNKGVFEKEFYDEFEGSGLKYWIKLNPKTSNKERNKNLIKRILEIWKK